MKKSYMEFVEVLRRSLIETEGFREEQVYYVKQDENPAKTGDSLFVVCEDRENAREVCALHIDGLYRQYQQGESLENIQQVVLDCIRSVREDANTSKALSVMEYEEIKEDLFVRLLNSEKNKEELETVVHGTVGDIALVLYMKVSESRHGLTSMKINRAFLKQWQKSEKEVMEQALLNTYLISPPRVYQWRKMLDNPNYSGENFMDLLTAFQFQKDGLGNCLSTTKRTNGAVAVFLPGVSERIAQMMGQSFYMVFTSVHEVMIHNEQSAEVEKLREVLKETVEETTPPEDFLSYYIYHYEKETGEITFM